jgi:hypothetical protein
MNQKYAMKNYMLPHFYLFLISGAVSGGKSEIGHCGGINNPVHYVRYFITAVHKVNIYLEYHSV